MSQVRLSALKEVAAAAASEAGHRGLVLAAKMLSMTALDVINRPGLVREMKADFSDQRR